MVATRPYSRLLCAPLALMGMLPASPAPAALPPVPRAIDPSADMSLQLEVVLNGAPSGRIVPVTARAGQFLMQASDLRGLGVTGAVPFSGTVAVGSLPGVTVHYDETEQRLLLTVPDDWLPGQRLGRTGVVGRYVPQSSFGALVNYDLYAAGGNRGGGYASLWSEVRLFGAFGVAHNTGLYRRNLSGSADGRYIRYDTSWTYVDDEKVRTYEAGDFVTATLPWGSPVRLGGFQLSRNFAVRPDIVTYPVLRLSGTASVPSAVDLFIDGYRTSSGTLQPGPFTLTDVPYMNGAGEAVVVTTDALGRQVSTSVPFYVANTLLRPGLVDYALAVGKLRQAYGLRNFSYGAAAASGSLRYGLSDMLTLEASAEAAPSHLLLGGGGVMRLGNAGVIDLSAAFSRDGERTGHQVTIGYQYTGRRVNLIARQVWRSADFADLSIYDNADFDLPSRQTQVSASMTPGGGLGTLGAGYIESRRRDDRFRLATFSWQKSLWGRSLLLLSASRDLRRRRGGAMLQLVLPLGTADTAVGGVERSPEGAIRSRIGYNHAMPTVGGFGGSLSATRSDSEPDSYRADLVWRTQAMQVRGGIYGQGGNQSRWGEISGSLAVMDGGVFPANRINDAFVLVTTDGMPGVPVLYENQRVGVTDGSGHLLIPWTAAWHGAKYAIDPLNLPADALAPVVEQRAAVRQGSGRLLRFPVRQARSVMLFVEDTQGAALKAGTPVTLEDGATTWVGLDGMVYVEDVKPFNRLTAMLPDGTSCRLSFPAPQTEGVNARIGPLPCR